MTRGPSGLGPGPGGPGGGAEAPALLGRLWGYLVRHRWMVALVLLLGLLESFLVKAPLALAMVIVNVLFTGAGEAAAGREAHFLEEWVDRLKDWLFAGWAPEAGSPEERMALLLACVVIIAALAAFGALAMALFAYYSRYLATRVVMDLRERVAGHLVSLPMRFFSGSRLGDLLSRVTHDTATTMQAFNLVFENVVRDPMRILWNVGLIALVNVWLALVVLVMVPAIGMPLLAMGRGIRRSSAKSLKAMGDSTEAVTQMLSGIRTVKAFQLEESQLSRFAEANSAFLARTRQLLRKRSRAQGVTFLGYNLGFAGLFLTAGYFTLNHGLSPGELALIMVALSTMYGHVKPLTRAYQVFQESSGALDRLEEVLRLQDDVTDRPGAVDPGRIEGTVEFDRVSFAYEDAPVLRDVSFRVAKGQTVALVGPSGAGKSTALDLIARFYDPTSGVVRVDGHDLRDLKVKAYRRHVAVVSQAAFLFNSSIEDNIRQGRPGASFQEVVQAAKAAGIHDFIESLPAGFGTVVGERGSRLSGGQMQRITIARALLKDASILLLDEATSALDSESEELVQQALRALMMGRTCVVIAHRLSTVRSAERILVMDRGCIVQQGRHEELVAQDGLYRRLHDLQTLREPVGTE